MRQSVHMLMHEYESISPHAEMLTNEEKIADVETIANDSAEYP